MIQNKIILVLVVIVAILLIIFIGKTLGIIGVGKAIYDFDKEAIDMEEITEQVSQQAVESFNAKFKSYEGKEISGSKIKMLEKTVEQSNLTNSEHKVEIISKEIVSSNNYTVKLHYDKSGYVNKIEIK